MSEFPNDVLADSGAFGEEIVELVRALVFDDPGGAGDQDFSILPEFVFKVVGDGVAGEAVVLL